MKSSQLQNTGAVVILTIQVLKELKEKGFKFVSVNAFTRDRRVDYLEPSYLELVPIKVLPEEKDEKGIYEPIDSRLLAEWANAPDEGIKVLVSHRGYL
jgi:hypothetical protein